MLTKLKALLVKLWAIDLVKRAAHTFWQAFAGVLIAFVVGGGLDFAHLPSFSLVYKVVLAAVVAGIGAVLSLAKTYFTGKATA